MVCVFAVCAGLWGTALTEDTSDDRELYVRTTLRELVVYIVFLLDICLCEYSETHPSRCSSWLHPIKKKKEKRKVPFISPSSAESVIFRSI